MQLIWLKILYKFQHIYKSLYVTFNKIFTDMNIGLIFLYEIRIRIKSYALYTNVMPLIHVNAIFS